MLHSVQHRPAPSSTLDVKLDSANWNLGFSENMRSFCWCVGTHWQHKYIIVNLRYRCLKSVNKGFMALVDLCGLDAYDIYKRPFTTAFE